MALIIGLCVGLWPCDDGFSGRGVGNCKDVDECADPSLHDCHTDALCDNNIGSWTCSCKTGHEGTGQACQDLDECLLGISFDFLQINSLNSSQLLFRNLKTLMTVIPIAVAQTVMEVSTVNASRATTELA